ncbi:uncharacterized protein LOC133791609 [Humulus lupulus]|uniref:uncharacterized protein LOC133791609 n=1 Tax=Humulus lupulus TaxID=3486 RepID=UPI002B417692|nr:uncharacterized protein LOC133791609 [Humulus lupulus]
MARRKKAIQKPDSRSSETVISSSTVLSDAGLQHKELACENLVEEVFADTFAEFPVIHEGEGHGSDQGGARLTYEESLLREGKLIAQVHLEEIEVEASFWNSTLVCIVLGANPLITIFEGFIRRLWGKLGIERVARMNAGYTIVKFRDEATRDLVLESGVVHFDRKAVILRPWSTDLDTLRLVKLVSVWIRLPNLGLQYWGTKCLSALVSTIGRPMMIDKITKDRSMVKFPRVLVDIEIAEQLPHTISFMNECGQLMEQTIEYEWLPTRCSTCKNLGHIASGCKREQISVWRAKVEKPYLVEVEEAGLISQPAQVKENSCSSAGPKQVWTTPKRVTVSKQVIADSQPRKNNQYSDIAKVKVLWAEDQLIHCCVKIMGVPQEFFLTIIYGRNSIEERKRLWQALYSLLFPVQPWLVVGDFNAVFEFDDRVGGQPVMELEMEDARNWRANSLMTEMGRVGAHYTWSNKQVMGVKPFKFFNMWANHVDFRETVLNSWSVQVTGTGLRGILQKLTRLKAILYQFNKLKVGDVTVQYSKAKEKFQQAQFKLQQDPLSPVFQQAEQDACLEFSHHSKMYESFLRQRSKNIWLRFGDENTSYFHASLKHRTVCNRITSFLDDHGQIIDCYEDVVAHFINHFKGFMGNPRSATTQIQQECFQHGSILNLDQQLSLVELFTKRDVKVAMFSIHSVKSPGPDGFGSGFFKSMWKDLGDELSNAILNFFATGRLRPALNRSIIALIPKVESPSTTVDYRPIACCNTLYKYISKMLCVRLAKVLPPLVHQNQGAFIQHRSLAHNIFILQDLLKGYSRTTISS